MFFETIFKLPMLCFTIILLYKVQYFIAIATWQCEVQKKVQRLYLFTGFFSLLISAAFSS